MPSAPPSIGYAAMLERFHPTEILELASYAEQHGFTGVMAADRFQPWVPKQGQASFVWNVLGALGQTTSGDLGTGMTVPTFRQHPAMVAQASATLAAMYPGRHWLGIGSGEAIDEHVVGAYWPETAERINRMFEAIDVIRKLFAASAAGRDTKHTGPYFKLESSRLWTMPETAPDILVATAGPVAAKRAGRTVEGLIIDGAPLEKIEGLFARFDEGAREVGKDPSRSTKVLRLHLSWATTGEEAMTNALTEWPNGGLRFPRSDIRSPYEFEQLARLVRPEDFEGRLLVSEDPDVHRANIQRYLDLGFDRIYLHNVGRNQREWMDVFGRDVLPKLVR
ncbi:MAG: coenzyme F420-dependent glucose-6-phosphate dehydrogenase [Actinomycetota bacterium]|jgi:coenzyme F420-dependent glucose-6-phosphate dehydrogenase|nr:flavin-dependent oxidoreductase, F420-dependent methylene-tetrahydromethanopterin reductase [Glaciihabitans sp.]MDQ1544286.1 coenzyme F420-dependent glucose-6-phosphate dehydrogenase [Actinomycetota bacterium]MDQ1562391.1 coenzyme F420-dependent glucose-6-phosphate dehydrogenase [Actinomycetota bacterium]MDQ1564672.1 coenzyme F420-dependent glucose-6-phosphate dehydrogenase [Actinomycetota bacterium]